MARHFPMWIPWQRRPLEKAVTHTKVEYKRKPKVREIYFTQTTFWFDFLWDDCYSNRHFRRTTIPFQHPLQLLQDSQKPVRRLCRLHRACESWVQEVPSSDTDRRPIQMLNLYSRSPLTRWFRNTFPTVSKAGNRWKGESTRFDSWMQQVVKIKEGHYVSPTTTLHIFSTITS